MPRTPTASAAAGFRQFARQLGQHHELALRLWDTGVHDARLLATLVEVPREAGDRQMDRWVLTANHPDLSDAVCRHVVLSSVFARSKVADWKDHPQELVRRSAYVVLAHLARSDPHMTDADFTPYVDAIPALIHREGPIVSEFMRVALARMGARNPVLRARAATAAARIRRVSSGALVLGRGLQGDSAVVLGPWATSPRRAG